MLSGICYLMKKMTKQLDFWHDGIDSRNIKDGLHIFWEYGQKSPWPIRFQDS